MSTKIPFVRMPIIVLAATLAGCALDRGETAFERSRRFRLSTVEGLCARNPANAVLLGNAHAARERMTIREVPAGNAPLCISGEVRFVGEKASLWVFGYDADRAVDEIHLFVPIEGKSVHFLLLPYGRAEKGAKGPEILMTCIPS